MMTVMILVNTGDDKDNKLGGLCRIVIAVIKGRIRARCEDIFLICDNLMVKSVIISNISYSSVTFHNLVVTGL